MRAGGGEVTAIVGGADGPSLAGGCGGDEDIGEHEVDLEMGAIKGDTDSLNEEEESLLVSRDDLDRHSRKSVQGGDNDKAEKKQYLGGADLPNIIITPTRRHIRPTTCSFATVDSDIQLAEPRRSSSSVSVVGLGGAPTTTGLRALCGPQPGKISLICLVVLSIWASWIFIIHLNKELSEMALQLEESNGDVKALELSAVAFRLQSESRINKLQNQIHTLVKRRKDSVSARNARKNRPKLTPSGKLPAMSGSSIEGTVTKGPLHEGSLAEAGQPTENPFHDEKWCGANGEPCIFPFHHNANVQTGCVRSWYNPRAWCPTKLGPDGVFNASDPESVWDYCQSCPE